MYTEPRQSFGFFETALFGTVLAGLVFVSFCFLSDTRQPQTARLTYLGLEDKTPPQDVASSAKAQSCLDGDLPCLPEEGLLVAERPSE